MSVLFPDGITSLYDLPHTVFDAIRVGLGFVKFDELPEDETPPRRIWTQGDELTSFFQEVRRKREADMKGDTSAGPLAQNDAAKALIVE